MKLQDQTAQVNGDFTLNGGILRHGPNDTPVGDGKSSATMVADNFIIDAINGGTFIAAGFSSGITVDGNLTGSGNVSLETLNLSDSDNRDITFTGISAYTGDITVSTKVTAEFGQNYDFTGNFDLDSSDSRLRLGSGRILTFNENALTYGAGSTVVAPGTYSGGSLDTLGANFVNDGGTLVVIPEPGTGVLMLTALGACYLFSIRRRKR